MIEKLLNSIWYGRPRQEKIPILAILGLPGSGKTTLLSYLLHKMDGNEVAVLVNQPTFRPAESQILVEEHKLDRQGSRFIPLSGGCICCDLSQVLYKTLENMVGQKRLKYVFLEGGPYSEPQQLAKVLTADDHHKEIQLHYFSRLDAVLSVIDASSLLEDISLTVRLDDSVSPPVPPLHQHHSRASLLVTQIESANILVLNKIDLLADGELSYLTELLHALNPFASLHTGSFGQVDQSKLLHTQSFEGISLVPNPDWLDEYSQRAHATRSGSSPFRYISFADRRPFHPQRFWDFLQKLLRIQGLARIKGHVWLASRPYERITLSAIGSSLTIFRERPWWSSMPESERVHHDSYVLKKDFYRRRWDEHYGDRMNELLVVGERLKESELRMALDECLCMPHEIAMLKTATPSFTDPFPIIQPSAAEEKSKQRFKYLENFFKVN